MVVLGACATAKGKYYNGEGAMSIANSFFNAGAKSVITTLWAVTEESNNKIISSFYRHIAKGECKDRALQQAKIEYLDNSDATKRLPFYWAGFIQMGNTKAIENLSNTNFYLKLLGILCVVILYIVLIHRLHRSRRLR